ncbi:hypothetical protein MtrunA17_Chr5g0419711 [Medicago truncatula]|nr:hypothetical protein MtrunA17_Chr5g0419711 [Medicago truncatula]
MDFLRQSWDSMVENDADQQFQMVVSKKKKNNQKRQAEASKGSYPRRLMVTTSKGFQLKLKFLFLSFFDPEGFGLCPPSFLYFIFFLFIYLLGVAVGDPSASSFA